MLIRDYREQEKVTQKEWAEENKKLAIEDIALQVDRIENILAAMSMPVDGSIHIKALKESLPEMKCKLKQAYFELGGKDVWSI